MINIKDKRECCGCTACASICPQDAITMKPDLWGFMYPSVDVSKCVECGLCDKVCAFNDNYDRSLNFSQPKVYAARHKDMEEIMASRSGALFAAISDYVLDHDGVIYGVGYTGHFCISHKRATNKEERDDFRGSKYVQSNLNGIFIKIKEDLDSNRIVLFSGTPCQTAGLNSYIGKKLRKNLILVDIICHGVSAPQLWRDYVNYLERKENSVIISVNFRDKKEFGWKAHVESFIFEKNPSVKVHFNQSFYKSISFRSSCGNCHFCNTHRPSDITIGDLWGWEKICPEMNADDKGINLVMLNTAKGESLFSSIKDSIICNKIEDNSYLQLNLTRPTEVHKKRDNYERDYIKKGIDYVVNHDYDAMPFFSRVIRFVKNYIIRKVFNNKD